MMAGMTAALVVGPILRNVTERSATVWVHAAIVAADGSGDPEGDGVRVLSRLVPSYGNAGEAMRVGSPACSATPSAPASPSALVVLALAWVVRRRYGLQST